MNAIKLIARGERLPRKQPGFASKFPKVFLLLALAYGTTTLIAQHTTVEKNGLAGTIETDRNAADKATEMRTLGVDGKLRQKVHYDYLPGHYGPDQTDTTYWPSGQARKVVRKSYDESANFISEFIQLFDESGKQIAGHKLTHDPWTGTYRCAEWNAAGQNYRDVECPSGEEESGGNPTPKKFTYDEVMKHLDAARKTAKATATMAASAGAPRQELAIVLPVDVRPGERVSGTVVEDPARYAESWEVIVTKVALPLESSGEGSRLAGWLVEIPGEEPQRADGPITFIVPSSGSGMNVTFREAGNPGHSVSQTLKLSLVSANADSITKAPPANSFAAQALCMKGQLCALSGPFSGDSRQAFAAFEDRPATVVAETSDAAYIAVPELTGPGSRPVFITEGSKVVGLPVVVGDFFIRNNGRALAAGESLITFPTLDGPGDVPDAAWQAGNFSASDLERARHLIPGFTPTGGVCRAHEKEETAEGREREKEDDSKKEEENEKEEDGRILIVIRNLAPEQASLHGSKNNEVVFCLSDEAFQRGAFKYDLRIDARKAGKADVRGYVIPFLAPVAGQEFSVKGTQ